MLWSNPMWLSPWDVEMCAPFSQASDTRIGCWKTQRVKRPTSFVRSETRSTWESGRSFLNLSI